MYQGNHKPLISKELWEEVQIQLTVAPKAPAGTKEFSFTRMIKCGACKTGITAEEKLKKLKTGEIRRYVYYHCGRANDLDCEQPYIREAYLMIELLGLIDELELDEIGAQQQFKEELERYEKFIGVLGQNGQQSKSHVIDLKSYAKYVMQHGTKDEKREILQYVSGNLYLKDRKVYVERKRRSKNLTQLSSNPIAI